MFRSYKRVISAILMLAAIITMGFVMKDINENIVYSEYNGTYGGTDELGRVLSLSGDAPAYREGRYVGLFYFLWQGQHGVGGPYDNYKIVSENPDAIKTEKAWIDAGGGPVTAHHFWAEPLFGYYTSDDEWVMRKHIQMLTDADVDFIAFDATNTFTYDAQALKLLKLLDEYYKKGWDVPKIVYYTNTQSGIVMTQIYQNIYVKHPEYSHLWFNWDGKPLIIGNVYEATKAVQEFYTIRANQWPYEDKKEDGFPWMEFSRSLTKDAIYGLNGRKEVMNVSVAQHGNTFHFSESAWYGKEEKSRSWHNGELEYSDDAIMWGYNFAEQFEFAIEQDPEIIFITGWNEWVAQRQTPENHAVSFVDCADPENSRDIEPMNGLFGDNYYMQMVNYIRQFKGVKANVNEGELTTVDINGSFDQWNNITAVYKDYTGDITNRKSSGFGNIKYENTTGRNDFDVMKVCRDFKNVYFYVSTTADITETSGMNLFLSVSGSSEENWQGYNYVVNRIDSSNGEFILEKCTGDWEWIEVGKITYKLEGNKIMFSIPRNLLGISVSDVVSIQFKWADNCDVSGDVFKFYQNGDVAPYGRMNYVYTK